MSNFADKFNDGEPIVTSEGSSIQAEERLLKLNMLKVIPSKFDPNNYNYEIWLNDEGGSEAIVWQPIYINQDGSISSPLFAGYTKNDGTEVLPMPLYEFYEASKLKHGEAKIKARLAKCTNEEGGVQWKRFFEGLTFPFMVKGGKKKDGSGDFMIVLTERQKRKDEQYRLQKETAEVVQDNIDLAEKTKDAKVESVSIDEDDLPF